MAGPQNTRRGALRRGHAVLDARIAEARGDRKAAIASWRAVAAEDALAYDEPPAWYYPMRESLGAALLADGQAAEAEKVFREDLASHPRNGRSLYGLPQTLKAQKQGGRRRVGRRAVRDGVEGRGHEAAVEEM